MLGLQSLRVPFVLVRGAPLLRFSLALSFLALACSGGGSGSSAKGLSELCDTRSECASGECSTVTNQIHSQCTASCMSNADCEKIDPRAICHPENELRYCVLGCGKDTDCPEGALCDYPFGCFQN